MSGSWAARIWTSARLDGAPSRQRYQDALRAAMAVDRADRALDHLEVQLARVADECSEAGGTPVPDDALGAVDALRLVAESLLAALAGLRAMRRRSRFDARVSTPAPLPQDLVRFEADLVAVLDAYDVERHERLGHLHGMPDTGARALVADDHLFTDAAAVAGPVRLPLRRLRDGIAEVGDVVVAVWGDLRRPGPDDRVRGAASRTAARARRLAARARSGSQS